MFSPKVERKLGFYFHSKVNVFVNKTSMTILLHRSDYRFNNYYFTLSIYKQIVSFCNPWHCKFVFLLLNTSITYELFFLQWPNTTSNMTWWRTPRKPCRYRQGLFKPFFKNENKYKEERIVEWILNIDGAVRWIQHYWYIWNSFRDYISG